MMKIPSGLPPLLLLLGATPRRLAWANFLPMHCNLPLLDPDTSCVSFSSMNYDTAQKVEIECGTCVVMDAYGDELMLEGGLDVVGRLIFPASRSALKIVTPFVFVQGELIVEPLQDKHAPQADRLLEFHFVGTDDVYFARHHNQTYEKCDGEGCNLSKKPFVVAGGKVDFRGLDDDCRTWSRLKSVDDAGAPPLPVEDAPEAPEPPGGCSGVLVDESFDDAPSEDFDGIDAAIAAVEDGYYTVSGRPSGYTGPRVHLPIDCITPNASYVLRFKFRYRHVTPAEFAPPYVKMIQYYVGGGNDWISAPFIHTRGQMTNVGVDEWHEMEMALEFDEIMANSTQTSDLTIYIAPMTNEADTIDIDDFLLELAPPEAFEKSCGSLLLNGRADFSRRHAYPFYPTGGLLNVASDGTGPAGIASFFRSTLRSSQWSSALSQDIASACLRKAAVYDFSAYVRVHSFVERRVSFSLRVEGGDGGTVEHSIVECPPSSGEWVSCSSKMRWEEDAVADVSARLHPRPRRG